MYVPIPTDFWCDVDDSYGCWFELELNFPALDGATWKASIAGDPVRLIG